MSKHLRLLGSVRSKNLEYLGINPNIGKSKAWFFVDDVKKEYPLNSWFDIRLSGDATRIEGFVELKLVRILDERGKDYPSILVGEKRICQFQFVEKLPSALVNLNHLGTWERREKSAVIANAQDLIIQP